MLIGTVFSPSACQRFNEYDLATIDFESLRRER